MRTDNDIEIAAVGLSLDEFTEVVQAIDPPPTRAAERPVEHTPTPWELEDDSLVLCLMANGYTVMTAGGNPKAEYGERNAEANANILLVHEAVNNHATLLRQKRELVDVLRLARRIVGDRAAGGRMITTASEASDVLDHIDTALNAAVGEGEGGR